MSSAPPLRPRWTDSLRPQLMLPSWLLSLAFHGAVVLSLALAFRGGTEGRGESEGEFRDVGIYVKPLADEFNTPDAEETESAFSSAANPFNDQLTVPDQPPVELTKPPTEAERLGSGRTAPPTFAAGDVRDQVKGGGVHHPAMSTPGGKPGDRNFFGATDSGTHFVYLIDCSGSMARNNAMGVAKAELKASLQSLDREQRFQIMFYNSGVIEMKDRSGNPELLWATDTNRNLADSFIRGIQPDRGTDHVPALKKALRYKPDVLFFLTDGLDPPITGGELEELKRLNNGRTRIHCVEFGVGPELSVGNFLKVLAQQNGGSYHYRDVTKFGQR